VYAGVRAENGSAGTTGGTTDSGFLRFGFHGKVGTRVSIWWSRPERTVAGELRGGKGEVAKRAISRLFMVCKLLRTS
jgi:hypothetical protein